MLIPEYFPAAPKYYLVGLNGAQNLPHEKVPKLILMQVGPWTILWETLWAMDQREEFVQTQI